MEGPIRRLDLNYALSWVVANALAWAVGIGLPSLVAAEYESAAWVEGVAGMLLMGGAQWWVLSRAFPHSPWWLVGYALAWFVGIGVGAHLGFLVPDPVWAGATGGAIAGLMQSLVLRRHVGRAIAWLPTMIVSAIVGCVAGVKVGWAAYQNGASQAIGYAIGAGVAGATLGFLSAIVLLYFGRRAGRETAGDCASRVTRPRSRAARAKKGRLAESNDRPARWRRWLT